MACRASPRGGLVGWPVWLVGLLAQAHPDRCQPDRYSVSTDLCWSLRDGYVIAEQPAPAPHLAHPDGCAAPRILLVTLPRVSRSCEHFPDGFDLHLLQPVRDILQRSGFGEPSVAKPLNPNLCRIARGQTDLFNMFTNSNISTCRVQFVLGFSS